MSDSETKDEGIRCRHLHFNMPGDGDTRQFIGCVGSLGELKKLLFKGYGISEEYARFMLYTDSGVYGISTEGYEPGYQTMRFLSVWRENDQEFRALLFEPRIVASIEKAGLSFMKHSRSEKHKADDEIELLDHYTALEYLKNNKDFHVDLWPLQTGTLEKVLWCDKDWRPLCEREEDACKMAEHDYGLWGVLSASHPSKDDAETFDSHYQQSFMCQRYEAYAKCRSGVVGHWERWP